jgi:predicted RNA-binding protein Jag
MKDFRANTLLEDTIWGLNNFQKELNLNNYGNLRKEQLIELINNVHNKVETLKKSLMKEVGFEFPDAFLGGE